MTRIASILLLTVFAFNWGGYRIVADFLEQRADKQLEAHLDKADYDETLLFEIRVPLNTPYLAGNSTEFERYEGEIEVDGVHYKYVKRKVDKGELVLLCIPNSDKNRFQNSRMEFFKLMNDLNSKDQSKDGHHASVLKTLTMEYRQETNCWAIYSLQKPPATDFMIENEFLSKGMLHAVKHPPRV